MKKNLPTLQEKNLNTVKFFPLNRKVFSSALAFLAVWLITSTANAQFGASPWKAPTGTFTVPAGVTSITVECQGGGGGGGGNKTGSCSYSNGGGGGGGAYSIISNYAVTPGQTIQVVVGAAGTKGASSGGTGGAGGQSSVAYNSVIFVSAAGGNGGGGSQTGPSLGTGGSGGASGIGFLYSGGNGAGGSGSGSGGGGGCAGSSGAGSNATGTSAGGGGFGNPFGGTGAAGKPNSCDGWAAGGNGGAPGGGGSGAMSCGQMNCSASFGAGGAGGAGQVTITYTLNPTCTMPCAGWFIQDCTICPTGCYTDAGNVVPTSTVQTSSQAMTTSNYGFVFWNFNATAGTTYYFDLCSSTGTAGDSWLRLHKSRITSPSNNYCMDGAGTPTIVIQNVANGCTGTGTGLSKLIWTCQTSGTYYLESAIGTTPTYWGTPSSQTAILSYKTLPSSSFVCADVFYDKGRDGIDGSTMSYNNNESWTYTYYPVDTITSAITASFVSFSTSPGDILCVYDGSSINDPIIGCYSGPSITGTFTSTASNGSLTFQFSSDDTGISAGWQADISCVANVAVGNYASATKVRIFPNPAKDQLEISGLSLDEITTIQIFDVVGKSISTGQAISQSLTTSAQSKGSLDISALTSGIYFIRIENASGKWNAKFVKE